MLQGRLPPEVGALLVKALQKAETGAGEDSAEPGQRLCDALGEVAGAALDRGLAERQGKARSSGYQVLVHVDEAALTGGEEQGRCEVSSLWVAVGGHGHSPETARRLCCDAPVLEVRDAQPCSHDGHQGHGEKGCEHKERACGRGGLVRARRELQTDQPVTPLQAHELHVLLQGGDPEGTRAAPAWRPLTPG